MVTLLGNVASFLSTRTTFDVFCQRQARLWSMLLENGRMAEWQNGLKSPVLPWGIAQVITLLC